MLSVILGLYSLFKKTIKELGYVFLACLTTSVALCLMIIVIYGMVIIDNKFF